MDLLVTYDVNTLTREGRRRLRKVAKLCEGHGQRVQFSVFEVSVSEMQKEKFVARLVETIDRGEDSLRIYVLRGGREAACQHWGRDTYIDFTAPLVV